MIRLLLWGLIILLIVRMFNSAMRPTPEKNKKDPIKRTKNKTKKVSKDVGEYVDFEEVDDDGNK